MSKPVFSFSSFDDWCHNAQVQFRRYELFSNDVACIDSKGRLCLVGKQFMRARDERTFPVDVYRLDDVRLASDNSDSVLCNGLMTVIEDPYPEGDSEGLLMCYDGEFTKWNKGNIHFGKIVRVRISEVEP